MSREITGLSTIKEVALQKGKKETEEVIYDYLGNDLPYCSTNIKLLTAANVAVKELEPLLKKLNELPDKKLLLTKEKNMGKPIKGWINDATPIHIIIEKKGSAAKIAISGMLYNNNWCDTNSHLSLSDAAETVEKPHVLPSLIAVLNKIRDISK
jgi:hypothetical protein